MQCIIRVEQTMNERIKLAKYWAHSVIDEHLIANYICALNYRCIAPNKLVLALDIKVKEAQKTFARFGYNSYDSLREATTT